MGALLTISSQEVSSCPPCAWNLLYIFFPLLPAVSAPRVSPTPSKH